MAEYVLHDIPERLSRHFLDCFPLAREVVMSGRAAPLVDVTAQKLSRLWVLLPRTFGVAEYLLHELAEDPMWAFLDCFPLARELVMAGRAAPLVDVTAQSLCILWILLLRATHMAEGVL